MEVWQYGELMRYETHPVGSPDRTSWAKLWTAAGMTTRTYGDRMVLMDELGAEGWIIDPAEFSHSAPDWLQTELRKQSLISDPGFWQHPMRRRLS